MAVALGADEEHNLYRDTATFEMITMGKAW